MSEYAINGQYLLRYPITIATPTKISKRVKNVNPIASTLCGVRNGVGIISKNGSQKLVIHIF
jgi:hypothetical protein